MNKEKMIPKIRFVGFIDDWEQRKLGDLADIVRGASPRPIQDPKWFDSTSDVGWLRIADVTKQNGRIYNLEQKISLAGQEKTRVLISPHLLLSIAATVGKPVVNYVKTGVHDGFLIFLNPLFEMEFMFQWLEMFRPKWVKYGQPGSQVNLNSELVRNQDILIPNIKEQARIAAFFKQIDDTIALHQQLLTDYKQLKKALLQQLFPQKGETVPKVRFADFSDDWKVKKLGEVGSVAMCKRIFKDQTSEFGDIPFFKIGTFGKSPDAFIPRPLFEEYKEKYSFPELGDILISASGTIGRTVVYKGEDAYFQDSNIIWFKRNKKLVDNTFLKQFYQIVKWAGLEGSTIKRLYNSNILSTLIYLPSLNEQEKIGQFFKQLDETIDGHQQKLATYQELKRALLQRMFV
ncbi:restriction endonuclease subunit S [Jeotgalibaca sp. MA1X17-3]|uniref:restriction endonuclease subunit S n=1 Tax=Jeotgalibaca sp. MA1X17-3 TaxID=2908211 RepID=UPI001F3243B6|nr:restriction endonuclease subunit S [Jeotgalibaca sp. MA1X17-3]UJF15865.1 restriction endonuclease subunit S [Jeotgalibaca sp. MA1X17-3]